MLSPEYLDQAPDALVELYAQVEQDILADMARRINAYDYYIPSAEHQRQRLRQAGMMQQDILRRLSKMTGRTQKELRQMMRQTVSETVDSDKAYYRRYGLRTPTALSAEMLHVMRSGLRKTNGLFRNLTGTTASAGQQQFIGALDRAWLQVSSGGFDHNTAVRNAVKDLSQKGVSAISYPSGRQETLEVAVRRAVLTGVNQTSLQLSEQLADEVGCDLVETSAHAGARPSHAVWQGQIFSRSGKSAKYPSLREATGYGTGAGLGGWNCRHNMFPYVDGAPRAYSEDQLKRFNAKTITYNDRQYTEYEASQIQRYHERKIRRWKRENIAMAAAGQDTYESASKIKYWQDRQKDFVKQTGLKHQSAREQIAGFGRSEARKATDQAKKIEFKANMLYNLGSTEKNVAEYLKYKTAHDEMEAHNVDFVQWIYDKPGSRAKEAVVKPIRPIIEAERTHAIENREQRAGRRGMTIERAQVFVDKARLVLYQADRHTLKFLAQEGYAILNFDHELVTAVPQKWRRKYDKYLGDTL